MKMKKIVALAAAAVLTFTSLTACGSKSGGTQGNTAGTGEENKEAVTNTIGSDSGDAVELEMWTFIELHQKFYSAMVTKWNEKNPDKQIKIKVNVLPYDDMHNKLQIALNAGEGTPDMVDIELGKFPNFTQGVPQLKDLTEMAAPYIDDIVKSRLDIYSKDGVIYGYPTHVGATVAFYNTELLESAGIDYTTIETWDDFKESGIKYHDATGKYLGTADTKALWTLNALLAQYGDDYLDEDDNLQVNSETMVKALELLKDLQNSNAIATVPGGQPDTEEAYGAFNQGDYACAIMPLWQMSRYTNYMPDLAGKIAIAPIPLIDGAQAKSVGGGGTGTAVVAGKDHEDLAAEFLAYAKLSEDANVGVWDTLGFDPCNMSIWTEESVTHNPENEFVKYFVNNPFDVLNEIKDGIAGLQSLTSAKSPSINNNFCTIALNSIFEDDADIRTVLDESQQDLQNELE